MPSERSTFGRYKLIEKLTSGGMAEIWLAHQTGVAGFSRIVALKTILSHLSEEESFVKMFLDEARTSAQLNHPNIVQIYDLGEEQGTYFLAMEYIAGENLAAISLRSVDAGAPLAHWHAARIIAEAAKALHYAHERVGADGRPLAIVHRDVSPQNILVTYDGEVKVVDFGIAKAATRSHHTRTGTLKGKLSYMSPEQWRGRELDRRADVFGLGVVLYELVTGTRLFKHDSEMVLMEMITEGQVPPPSSIHPAVPRALDHIIMKALEKNRERRFQSAQDMQLALEAHLKESSQDASAASFASDMRKLFADRIARKQALCDGRSLEEAFADEETTDHSDPARPAPLADPPAADATTPMRVAAAQARVAAARPHPTPADATPPAAIPIPQRRSKDAIRSALSLIALGGAATIGGYLAFGLLHASPPTPPPKKESQLAILRIDSNPRGAKVYLNGKPVDFAPGRPALTPTELRNVRLGATYELRLEKPGFEPKSTKLNLTAAHNDTTLRIDLTPSAGELHFVIAHREAHRVQLFADDTALGFGPNLTRKHPPGPVTLRADLPGHRCVVTPSEPVVAANETTRITVTCRRLRRRAATTHTSSKSAP